MINMTSALFLILKERQNLSVNEVDISRVSAVIKVLKDTSHYHSSKFSDVDVTLVLKLLTTWSKEMLFPGNYLYFFVMVNIM